MCLTTGFILPPSVWLLIILVGGVAALLAFGYLVVGLIYLFGFVKVWWVGIASNAFPGIPDIHVWFSNIAHVPLSDEALARLEPRMVSHRTAKGGIARLLERGDGRAAVVVSTEPLIVAAYTDAFDAAVLFRFDPSVVGRELRLGDRLL